MAGATWPKVSIAWKRSQVVAKRHSVCADRVVKRIRVTPRDSTRPIARLTVAFLGGVLLGAVRPDRTGRTALRLLGLGAIAVAAQPLLEASVRRAGHRRRSVSFRSIIDVERPIAEVFAFFK